MTKEGEIINEDKPKETNPLWMPQGSVRALITFFLLLVTMYMLTMGIIIPEWFSILVVSSVSFYYGTRKTTTKPE